MSDPIRYRSCDRAPCPLNGAGTRSVLNISALAAMAAQAVSKAAFSGLKIILAAPSAIKTATAAPVEGKPENHLLCLVSSAFFELHVEAGEPYAGGQDIDPGDNPARPAKQMQVALIKQHPRRYAKIHEIGKGVELAPMGLSAPSRRAA